MKLAAGEASELDCATQAAHVEVDRVETTPVLASLGIDVLQGPGEVGVSADLAGRSWQFDLSDLSDGCAGQRIETPQVTRQRDRLTFAVPRSLARQPNAVVSGRECQLPEVVVTIPTASTEVRTLERRCDSQRLHARPYCRRIPKQSRR